MGKPSVAAGLLTAIRFAAEKHKRQRRKGADASPYINHPIEVAEILAVSGGVHELVDLQAAVLHDTIEDTQTTGDELERNFDVEVRRLVEEVTDDKSLPKDVRKRLQVEHAPALSRRAQRIKLADKICNVRDLTQNAPEGWSLQRCRDYLDWAEQVVAGCRGANPPLEDHFDQVLRDSRQQLDMGADTRRHD